MLASQRRFFGAQWGGSSLMLLREQMGFGITSWNTDVAPALRSRLNADVVRQRVWSISSFFRLGEEGQRDLLLEECLIIGTLG